MKTSSTPLVTTNRLLLQRRPIAAGTSRHGGMIGARILRASRCAAAVLAGALATQFAYAGVDGNGQDNCVRMTVELRGVYPNFGSEDRDGAVQVCAGRRAERCKDITLTPGGPGDSFINSRSFHRVGDHPHVDHPDDWDIMEIKVPDDAAKISLSTLVITLSRHQKSDTSDSAADFCDASNFVEGASYKLVNWSAADADAAAHPLGDTNNLVRSGRALLLTEEIEYQRRLKLCEINTGTGCRISDGEEDPDEHFSKQPRIIRSALGDIGQSGLAKYSGSSAEGTTQGGCDEVYSYHYVNSYFDGFKDTLDACPVTGTSGDSYCYLNEEGDRVIPTNMTGFPHGGWKQNGFLYRVRFDTLDGDRVGIRKLDLVKPDVGLNDGIDDYGTWETDRNVNYSPKAGDYLTRIDRCEANGHIMMLTKDGYGSDDDGFWLQQSSSGAYSFYTRVIDGSSFVKADEINLSLNALCSEATNGCTSGCSGKRFGFYVGESSRTTGTD